MNFDRAHMKLTPLINLYYSSIKAGLRGSAEDLYDFELLMCGEMHKSIRLLGNDEYINKPTGKYHHSVYMVDFHISFPIHITLTPKQYTFGLVQCQISLAVVSNVICELIHEGFCILP